MLVQYDATGVRSDQSILLAMQKSKLGYPDRLRRVSYRDPETNTTRLRLARSDQMPFAHHDARRHAVADCTAWIGCG